MSPSYPPLPTPPPNTNTQQHPVTHAPSTPVNANHQLHTPPTHRPNTILHILYQLKISPNTTNTILRYASFRTTTQHQAPLKNTLQLNTHSGHSVLNIAHIPRCPITPRHPWASPATHHRPLLNTTDNCNPLSTLPSTQYCCLWVHHCLALSWAQNYTQAQHHPITPNICHCSWQAPPSPAAHLLATHCSALLCGSLSTSLPQHLPLSPLPMPTLVWVHLPCLGHGPPW